MSTVAILIDKNYEDLEYWYPKLRLEEAGYKVHTVHLESGKEFFSKHGYRATSDKAVDEIATDACAAVVIPGGWAPDSMRQHEKLVKFVKEMDGAGKIVAAICHAGSMLVSAGIVQGKKVTSYAAIKDDLTAAGAEWTDKEVVVDGNLITSRTPKDLPAFMQKILAGLNE